MSEFLAQAEIVVRANTKPFIADFEKAVAAVEKTKVTVKITVNPAGFKDQLRQQVLAGSKGITAKIPVTPNMAGFRAQLQAAVLRASKGVTATVAVKAGAVKGAAAAATGGGVASGGVVDKRVAEAQLAVNKAIASGIAARRRLSDAIVKEGQALSDEERFATRLAREQLHLKASTEAVGKAITSEVPELLALAEAEQRAATAALALSEAQATRRALGVPIGVSTAGFQAAAAATANQIAADKAMAIAHQEALATNLALDQKAEKSARAMGLLQAAAIKDDDARTTKAIANEKKRQEAIAAEVTALEKQQALGATLAQLHPAVSDVTRTRDPLGRFVAGGGQSIGAEAAERNKQVTAVTKGIATVETELAKARRIATSATLIETEVERKLVASRAVLRLTTDAILIAEEAYEAALASGSVATIKAAKDSLELATARQVEAAATTEAAGKEAARAGFLTVGRRALVAQIANLTGLRGAALTAATGFIAVSAGVISLRKAVGIAAQLQSELAVFQVTAGATGDQMTEVSAKARELGKDITLPGVGAQDAAIALTELSKAGLGVQDSLDGARGVLQLATAANIDFTQATQLTASALNAFGLAGEEASHVADVLANSANESQGSITDAGVALQQSAAVARQAGLSLEDTVAALTLFARAGLRGSDAGTSLRTALIRLINPSKKAQEVIDNLGLKIRDANGSIDLSVFQQFTDATKNLTAAQRDQALAIVFGQDAIRGAAILAREGSRGLNAERDAIDQEGTAARVAAARTSGFAGAIENLNNQMESLGEVIGTVLLPTLTGFVNTTAEAVGAIERALEAIGKLKKAAEKPIELVIRRLIETDTKGVNREIDPQTGEFIEPKRHKESRVEKGAKLSLGLVLGAPAAVKQLQKLDELTTQFLEDFSGANLSEPTTLQQAMDKIKKDIALINSSKISPEVADRTFKELQQISVDLQASSLGGQRKIGRQLEVFLKKLQETSGHPRVVTIEARFLDKSFNKQVDASRLKLNDLVDELNKSGDKAQFGPTLKSLKELQQQLLHSGRTSSRQFGRDMQGVIDKVQAAAKEPVFVNITVPREVSRLPELKEGFKRDGFLSSQAFWDNFAKGIKQGAPGAAQDTALSVLGVLLPSLELAAQKAADAWNTKFFSQLLKGAKAAQKQQATAVDVATTQGEGQAAGFDRKVLDAQLAGSVNAEIAARKAAIKSRQRQIDRIEKAAAQGGPIVGGRPKLTDAALKGVTDAKKDIKEQQDAIDSLIEGQKSDAEQRAKDLKDKRDKADQAFLDALTVGRTPFERRVAVAQATAGADDNISALAAFRKRLQAEVVSVRKGVKDGQTKAKELQRLSDELFQNSLDIQAAQKERNDAIAQALQDKGTALVELGQVTGNFKLALKGFDLQIASAKLLLAKAKEDAAAQKKAAAGIADAGTQAAAATGAAATTQKKQFTVGKPKGLIQSGNIDILHRPSVPTPGKKGFTSSVRSITRQFEQDGKKIFALLPTVIGNKVVSDQAATQNFLKTGKNLGIFATEKLANAYAETLHNQQAGLTKTVNKSTADLVNTAISVGTKNIISDAAVTQAQLNVAKALKAKLDFITQTRKDLLESAAGLAEAKLNINPKSASAKSALLQIIDLQIAEANREAAAAKTLPERWQAATDAINLAQKKKEILAGELEKDQQTGTTVLDLLKQGIDTFNASAGNLINADQPFAGPNAFNADIAQFLKFRKKPPDLTDIGSGAGGGGFGAGGAPRGAFSFARGGFQFEQKADPIVGSLIEALKNLTKVTQEAAGNTSTANGAPANVPVVKGSPWAGKPWFNWGAQARSAQES